MHGYTYEFVSHALEVGKKPPEVIKKVKKLGRVTLQQTCPQFIFPITSQVSSLWTQVQVKSQMTEMDALTLDTCHLV